MTDKKYTDEEVKKALECCFVNRNCNGCPQSGKKDCLQNAGISALDLINSQQAEIEKHKKEDHEKFNKWLLLDKRTKERYAELYEEAKGVVRAEAIKEFENLIVNNLIEQAYSRDYLLCLIKEWAKEMTEGKPADFPKDYSYGY